MDETDANADAGDPGDGTLCTGVVTISSNRSLESDAAGEAITTLLEDDGNEITVREHVGADHDRVQTIVSRLLDRDDVDVVLTAGATGVEPTDITLEAVEPLLEKELATFSELFTVLAYEAIGTNVVTARTLAGVAEGTAVFCLPGDADAARLALEEIVLEEAATIVDRAGAEPVADESAEAASDASNGADPADGGA